MSAKVQVSDWVAFQRQGLIFYARVDYVRKMTTYPYEQEAVTTAGTVEFADVLEVRRG